MKNIITKTQLTGVVDELISQLLVKMAAEHATLQTQIDYLAAQLEEAKGSTTELDMNFVVTQSAIPSGATSGVTDAEVTALMANVPDASREFVMADLTGDDRYDLETIQEELGI